MKRALTLSALVLFCGCAISAQTEEKDNLYRANAGSVKITPEKFSFMGGYRTDPPRVAENTHDDLYARCLALQGAEGKQIIFVSLDLVAFLRHDVELVKAKLREKGIDVAGVFISATHTHSSPDTVGIWGGRDENYMTALREKIAALVLKTVANLKDAEVYVTQTSGAPLNRNDKPSGLDNKITTLFVKESGSNKLVSVLVNFGCHPETVGKDNKSYSADFPGALSLQIDGMLACPVLFVNGALGGMVTVNPVVLTNSQKGFEQTDEFSQNLVEKTFPPAISTKYYHQLNNRVEVKVFGMSLAIDNPALEEALEKGVIPSTPTTYEHSTIYAEAAVVNLGSFKIAIVPGEPTPDVSRNIQNLIGGDGPVAPVIFSLTNGEIGYILASENYDLPCFEQEREKSLGRKTGDAVLESFSKFAPVK